MKRSYLIALTVLATATFAKVSHADDAELTGLLDENVVTTASKVSEVGSTAPATSTVITAEQMRIYGMHTIGEAIDFLALGATGASTSSGVGFGVRGVNIQNDLNEHILLLIDGHAVNDPLRGNASLDYAAGIPIELIDHIELVLGPGSVLYGSNAMLGVVNVITKRASAFHGVRAGIESDLPTGVRGFAGVGYEFALLGAPSELTIAAEYRASNGPGHFFAAENTGVDPVTGKLARYDDGPGTGIWGGRKTQGEYLQEPALFSRLVSGNFEATFRASANRANFDYGVGHFDDSSNRIITRRFSGELRHHASLSSIIQVNTRLYADSYDERADFASSLGRLCPYGDITCLFATSGRARWAGIEVQSSLDWLKDGTFVTLVGVDPRLRSGQAKTDITNEDTGKALLNSVGVIDRTDAIVGAYLQQTWKPLVWLGLNGGMRLDYDSRFDPVVSPRFAAAFNVWHGGTLKAVYSQAFRAPSLNDSYFSTPQQPASNLQPESVRSAEVSIEQKLGAQRFLFGAFRSTWKNLVQLHYFTADEASQYVRDGKGAPPFSQFQNDASIQNYGFNAGFEGSFATSRLRYGLNVTGALSTNDASGPGAGLPLTTSPHMFGNARASYALPHGLPTLAVAGLYVAKVPITDAYNSNYPTIPYAATQITLRATASGDAPWVKGLSYRISANYQFADYTSEVVGPLTQYTPSHPSPYLRPTTQLVTTVGLQYQF
jgi:outer membrane receptor for ferrienterochelin and colicins